MTSLPVSAKTYFDDFAFDLVEYSVKRNSNVIGSYQGLLNEDEDGHHIAFLIGADIKVGDVLTAGNKSYIIKSIDFDTYNGNSELMKTYF